MTTTERVAGFDRAAAVRQALRTLVAREGLHGASMSAVAKAAGVATGTAYVHYASKEDLLFAAYLEAKRWLGDAAVEGLDRAEPPRDRFLRMWANMFQFLADRPELARFLVQVDSSPYAGTVHELAMRAGGDPVLAEAASPDMVALLAPLSLEILYDLGLRPAVRLAALGSPDDGASWRDIAEACWRAVTV